jgi:hypothetical protein
MMLSLVDWWSGNVFSDNIPPERKMTSAKRIGGGKKLRREKERAVRGDTANGPG